jgi:hypothetical protein
VQLCNDGCIATFSATQVLINLNGHTVLSGHRSPATRLQYLDVADSTASPYQAPVALQATSPVTPLAPKPTCSANPFLPTNTIADRVVYVHATLFSLALAIWCAVIDAGRLTTVADITSEQVRRYPPQSSAMIKGHLDTPRTNLRSTKPTPSPLTTELPASDPTIPETAAELYPQLTEPPAICTHHLSSIANQPVFKSSLTKPAVFLCPRPPATQTCLSCKTSTATPFSSNP